MQSTAQQLTRLASRYGLTPERLTKTLQADFADVERRCLASLFGRAYGREPKRKHKLKHPFANNSKHNHAEHNPR